MQKFLAVIDKYSQRIAEWSADNFGSQNGLGAAAPLLGFCEEVLFESQTDDFDERLDAYFDGVIFLCDLSHRLGVLDEVRELLREEDAPTGHANSVGEMHLTLGRLCQMVLKNRQGIRGVTDEVLKERAPRPIFNLIHACAVKAFGVLFEDPDFDYLEEHRLEEALVKSFEATVQEVLARRWK